MMRRRPSLAAASLFVSAVVCGCQRSSPQETPKPPPPPFEFAGEFGTAGMEPGQLEAPNSIAIDFFGNVFVGDRLTRRITKFDAQGHPLLSFDACARPVSVAVDSGGAIYVGTDERFLLCVYLPDGDFFQSMRGLGGRRFHGPATVTLDRDDHLLWADKGHVLKCDSRGRVLQAWGKTQQQPIQFSEDLILAAAPDGNLYVFDRTNQRMDVFTFDGEPVTTWPVNGDSADSVGRIQQVAVSGQFVFLFDPSSPLVHVFSANGSFKLNDSLGGHVGRGESISSAIAVSPRHELLVADPANHRVLRFKINF